MTPRISAIVCTYNRSTLLRRCLDGFRDQTLAAGAFEIVVVNNNSNDDTAAVAAEYAAARPNLVLVDEPRQGLSAARNRGLGTASAPLVAFLDDDAVASPDWLDRIVRWFDMLDDTVVMVGGDIDPEWGAPRPDWLNQSMVRAISAGLAWSDEARFVDGRDEWLFEGASGYRLGPLLEFGGFPEQLGRVGDVLLSGEAALHFRLAAAGYRFFYDPALRARHYIAAARLTRPWFRKRYFWQGVTAFQVEQYLRQSGGPAAHSMRIDLPVSEGAWLEAFDNTTENFERALATLYNLGYLLAAQGMILGK